MTPQLSASQVHHLQEYGLRATFLGSAQKDHETVARVQQGQYNLTLCTPESFLTSTGEVQPQFRSIVAQGKIGLVAIDETHLLLAWASFR